jgi:hypothetical protein
MACPPTLNAHTSNRRHPGPGGLAPRLIWPNGDPMRSAQNHTSPGHNLNAGYRRKKPALSRRDIVISSLCASATIAALGIVAEFGVPWISQPNSSVAINNVDVDSSQIGRITLQTDENECELMKFNNETGRTIENDVRCRKDVTLDAHDVPVPTGTVHRLDAISRSFLTGGH